MQNAGKKNEDVHPHGGCADAGTEFNPADAVSDDDAVQPSHPRPAPAPGVPVAPKEYERLKDQARHRRGRETAPAQEDAPEKRRD